MSERNPDRRQILACPRCGWLTTTVTVGSVVTVTRCDNCHWHMERTEVPEPARARG